MICLADQYLAILLYRNVNDVLFHSDGRSILSCSGDKTIKMWDIRSHQLIQHYAAHSDSVTSMALHPVRGSCALSLANASYSQQFCISFSGDIILTRTMCPIVWHVSIICIKGFIYEDMGFA